MTDLNLDRQIIGDRNTFVSFDFITWHHNNDCDSRPLGSAGRRELIFNSAHVWDQKHQWIVTVSCCKWIVWCSNRTECQKIRTLDWSTERCPEAVSLGSSFRTKPDPFCTLWTWHCLYDVLTNWALLNRTPNSVPGIIINYWLLILFNWYPS